MGAASSSSSSPSRPTPTDAAGGGANLVPALQGCATSSPSVWHGWGHGSGRAELAPSCSLLEIPCWWRSPRCPLPPPGSPHLYCLPLGSVPDSAEPRGGDTSPMGDEVSRQPAANTRFCCNAGSFGTNTARSGLGCDQPRDNGTGGGRGETVTREGPAGGAGCGHGAGDGAGRARGPPALTTY